MALKLKLNEPVELALTRPDPKAYTNEGRTSLMYSIVLRDGTEDKAFLTQAAAETIAQLKIQPREWFTLCKRKTPHGVDYFEVHTSAISTRTGIPAPAPTRKPTASATSPIQGNPLASSLMSAALIAAVDAAQAAERHAEDRGIPVKFGPDDIRAIANTLYIQASRDPLFAERSREAA
jgi:hypothetical protein